MDDVDNNSKQLSAQFSDAREAFGNIADRQTDAMKVSIYIFIYYIKTILILLFFHLIMYFYSY